jgi:hypothetical protein
MRLIKPILLFSLFTASLATQAVEPPQLEKLKTGILPAGGFYSIYAVSCDDQTTSNIVSSHRETRWCTNYDGQLSCYRRSHEASRVACSGVSVADATPGTLTR